MNNAASDNGSSSKARRLCKDRKGPLDPIDHFGLYSHFYPPFARTNAPKEELQQFKQLETLVAKGPRALLSNRGDFIQAIRLVSNVEEDKFAPTWQTKATVIRWMADLFFFPAVTQEQQARVAGVLSAWLTRLVSDHLPLVWQREGCVSCHMPEIHLDALGCVIPWEKLFDMVDEDYRRYLPTDASMSCQIRKDRLNLLYRLIRSCHRLWNSMEVGTRLCKKLDLDSAERIDLLSANVFFVARTLLLFSSGEFLHACVKDGKLFEWWSLLGNQQVSTWDSTFVSLLFRAVKWGWSRGDPLHKPLAPLLPFLFSLLQQQLNMSNSQKLTLSFPRDNIPGELTALLPKKLNILRKLCKIISMLLVPTDGLVDAPPQQTIPEEADIWKYLSQMATMCEPLSHPSNTGAWSVPVSFFTKQFVAAYVCRVSRERMSSRVVRATVSRLGPEGDKGSYRLGKKDDERVVNMFLTACLSGAYSRSQSAATNFESALKRLCFLCPDECLSPVLDVAMEGLAAVEEVHQCQSSLRVLSQILPIIVYLRPAVLPDILSLSLAAVDPSEPFKAVQTLYFQCLLLQRIGAFRLNGSDIDQRLIDEASSRLTEELFPSEGSHSCLISLHNYPSESEGAQAAVAEAKAAFAPQALRRRLEEAIEVTSITETWTSGWVDQILRYIATSTSSDSENDSVMSSIERTGALAARFALYFAARDTPAETARGLVDTFYDALLSGPNFSAVKLYGTLARALAQGRPSIAVKALLPKLLARQAKNMSDSQRAFELNIIASVARAPGVFLLPFAKEILETIQSALLSQSKEVCKAGVKLVRRAIESCIGVYVLTVPIDETDQDVVNRKLRDIAYGEVGWWMQRLDCLDSYPVESSMPADPPFPVAWHVGTKEEFEFAEALAASSFQIVSQILRHCLPKELADTIAEETPAVRHGSPLRGIATVNAAISAVAAAAPANLLSMLFRMPSFVAQHPVPAAEPALSPEMSVLSPVKLLSRSLAIIRHIIKGFSTSFPDERPRTAENLPVVSPLDSTTATRSIRYAGDVCLAIARIYLGLEINADSFEVRSVQPTVDLRGMGDSLVGSKLIKCIYSIVGREMTSSSIFADQSTRSSYWMSTTPWTSFCYTTHTLSAWQDMSRMAWLERLHCIWMKRVERRTRMHCAEGMRLRLALLIARLSNHFYATNRELAQQTLQTILSSHYGLKHRLLRFFLSDIATASEQLAALQRSKEAPPALAMADASASESLRAMADEQIDVAQSDVGGFSTSRSAMYDDGPKSVDLETSEAVGQAAHASATGETSAALELAYARITGGCYSLIIPSLMRRIWLDADTAVSVMEAILTAVNAAISRDQVQHRVLSLAQHVLNARFTLQGEPSVISMVREKVLPRLENFHAGGASPKWLYSLMSAAFAIVFVSPLSKSLSAEEWQLYLTSLFQMSDSTKFVPMVNTLASFGLLLEFHKAVSQQTDFHQLTPSTIQRMAVSLVREHRRGEKRNGPSEAAYSVLITVVKFDKTWPFDRIGRLAQGSSLHNALLVTFSIRVSSDPLNAASAWLQAAADFLNQPLNEKDYQLAACEVLGGVAKAVSLWRCSEERRIAWQELNKLFLRAHKNFDAALIPELLDAVRFGIGVSDPDARDWASEPFETMALATDDSSLTSIDVARRFELATILIKSRGFKAVNFINQVTPLTLKFIGHPSKVVRSEVAITLCALLCLEKYQTCPASLTVTLSRIHATIASLCVSLGSWTETVDVAALQLQSYDSLECRQAETLTLLLLRLWKMCVGHVLASDRRHQEALKLCFKVAKLRLDVISETAYTASVYGIASYYGMGGVTHEISLSTEKQFCLESAISLQELSADQQSWRVRQYAVRLIEIIALAKAMYFVEGRSTLSRLIEAACLTLKDSQAEVQSTAQTTLQALCVSMDDSQCKYLTQQFLAEVGSPSKCSSKSKEALTPVVLGLAALVLSRPYSVPKWLPETVTALARFGTTKAPYTVRKHVEETLQEFLRTHQDSWTQIHAHKFDATQLETLEYYRGSPVYFS